MPRRPTGYYGMRRGAIRVGKGQRYSARRGGPRYIDNRIDVTIPVMILIGLFALPYLLTILSMRRSEPSVQKKWAWATTILFWAICLLATALWLNPFSPAS